MGEGLIGQCALEGRRILLNHVPPDYVRIGSGLGEAAPLNIVVLPVLFEGQVKAVIELASFSPFTDVHLAFLEQLTDSVGVVLNTITATMRTEELLKQSQALTEQLQTRQDELTETNRRLEQQTKTLQQSEELLKSQQVELQRANDELEERARLLAEQKTEVERKNREIEQAKALIEEKAEQLTLTSKYKSEFLANMSHELRTPLNSLLILSKMLSENVDGNLMPRQVESAQAIHSSGSDLLELINDILDLAKVESGTMRVELAEAPFVELRDFVERTFRQVASVKGVEFTVDVDPRLPKAIRTDRKLLQQILRNLLSNAFKFTESGTVSFRMQALAAGEITGEAGCDPSEPAVGFVVSDTGIGIPKEKQGIIFEAFQQVDGTTSRKYGGTGLGLSISREITRLLGGRISVESTPGAGSTFALVLPLTYRSPTWRAWGPGQPDERERSQKTVEPDSLKSGQPWRKADRAETSADTQAQDRAIPDDREGIKPGDRVLLIVGEDPELAGTLLTGARSVGFKGIIASQVDRIVALAREIQPVAIAVDFDLPNRDGRIVLDRLRHDPTTGHIPVLGLSRGGARPWGAGGPILVSLDRSASSETMGEALIRIREHVERLARRILVADGDPEQRTAIAELLGGQNTSIVTVETGSEALSSVAFQPPDCLVAGRRLADMSGGDLVERIRSAGSWGWLPILIYTPHPLENGEEAALTRLVETAAIVRVTTRERLLYETILCLHQAEAHLPKPKRRMLEQARRTDRNLSGKRVLIVDDDVRNIFALTAMLERHEMRVLHAENGRDGIALFRQTPDVDLILMDIMMPGMDGYETIHEIRRLPSFRDLPIITLTAKAMKGDREKCIEAGASDYIAKPVDPEHLLSVLRVWLDR